MFFSPSSFRLQGNSWSGLYVLNPFDLPKCVVTVYIDGINNFEDIGHRFTLRNDENEMYTWKSLEMRVKERYPFGNNILARINLEDGIDAV